MTHSFPAVFQLFQASLTVFAGREHRNPSGSVWPVWFHAVFDVLTISYRQLGARCPKDISDSIWPLKINLPFLHLGQG